MTHACGVDTQPPAPITRGAVIRVYMAYQNPIHTLCTTVHALVARIKCRQTSLLPAEGLFHALDVYPSGEHGPRAHAGLKSWPPLSGPNGICGGSGPTYRGLDDIRGGPNPISGGSNS
jgi:hypothetical protein